MSFLKKEKPIQIKKGRLAYVLDFGSVSIKFLKCRYETDYVEILKGSKIHYPDHSQLTETGVEDIAQLIKAIRDELRLLASGEDQKHPKPVVVGVGGLGVEGYTSLINYRRAHPEKNISEQEFASILKKVEDRANEIIKKMIIWETADDSEAALINSEVLDLNLDGYSIVSPVNLKGERLAFVVFNSYTRKPVLDAIFEIIKKLGLNLVSLNSSMYALSRAVYEKYPADNPTAILDIGARTTEVGLIKGKRILGHIGFDVGGQAFTDSISSELDCEKKEAEILKLGFAGGKLQNGLMKDIRELVSSDCKVFSSGVELVVKEFPGEFGSPQKIYVAGGGALLPGVVSCLQSGASLAEGAVQPQVETLFPKSLSNYKDQTGQLNSPADMSALALSIDAIDLMQELKFEKSFFSKMFFNKPQEAI